MHRRHRASARSRTITRTRSEWRKQTTATAATTRRWLAREWRIRRRKYATDKRAATAWQRDRMRLTPLVVGQQSGRYGNTAAAAVLDLRRQQLVSVPPPRRGPRDLPRNRWRGHGPLYSSEGYCVNTTTTGYRPGPGPAFPHPSRARTSHIFGNSNFVWKMSAPLYFFDK